ncbi:PIN domain-containing protein [Glycomyces buryatensis]|uniref:Ribonuclease VapC n=1 Tax=Glycomyces buryatensis TaxID=2570927 RepID=A0A4S8Q9V4_9ACTN|nr:PIN domain-containing protein [Glycomyces buryatensis]THV41243.1 PIN domain nuclease [Glycomyces buryatensis]
MIEYLIDTSALIRIIRGQVDPAWIQYADRGEFGICEPVIFEFVQGSGKRQAKMIEAELLGSNEWVELPDKTGSHMRRLRRDLTERSMHTMFSLTDYLIAATAIQMGLTVLHEDKDFSAAARYFPDLSEQRISKTLPEISRGFG